MEYSDKMDKAQELTCEALERMEKEGIAPRPDNFEVWYNYYSGHPDVVGAIDKLKDNVTEEACHEIYNKFLDRSDHEDAVKQFGDSIQQAMNEIAGLLNTVKSATSEYGDSLEDVSGKIESAESLDELQDVISGIVEDTKRMVEHNHELEVQLSNSSTQVEELRENLAHVRREAMTDGLTGLANRKAFDRYLVAAAEDAKAGDKPMTLLMLDIDHFKAFNDNFGHTVGDQVLRLVARTLTDGVKGQDTAARYGGEEFAIILPETPLQGGVAVANKLREAVENKEVINKTKNENLGRITMSIGVAQFYDCEDLEELIERADAALYTAKQNGRNQVAEAPPPAEAKLQEAAQ